MDEHRAAVITAASEDSGNRFETSRRADQTDMMVVTRTDNEAFCSSGYSALVSWGMGVSLNKGTVEMNRSDGCAGWVSLGRTTQATVKFVIKSERNDSNRDNNNSRDR